jgi:hypothetical protein
MRATVQQLTCGVVYVLPSLNMLVTDGQVILMVSEGTSVVSAEALPSLDRRSVACAAAVVIAEGTTTIADRAFEGCVQMTSLVLPSTLTRSGRSPSTPHAKLVLDRSHRTCQSFSDYCTTRCTSTHLQCFTISEHVCLSAPPGPPPH